METLKESAVNMLSTSMTSKRALQGQVGELWLEAENLSRLHPHLQVLTGKKRRLYWAGKRAFDIVFSVSALIALSPLFLAVGLLLYLEDPQAGCFYAQKRVGRHGKVFTMWKFRSMVANADQMLEGLRDQNEKDGPVFKMRDDPRVTKIGRFLRKTSLDELPQFWNVLRGEMSLVGPRPALPEEVAHYNTFQRERLQITPGMTCYWQVTPNRDAIPFEEWVAMDVRYICERSWWVDLTLILKTIRVIFTCQGQ